MFRACAACGLALLFIAPVFAEPVERSERLPGADGAVVSAKLDRAALSLSEALTLTLTIEARSPLEMEPIKLLTTSKVWLIAPLGEAEVASLPKQRMRWQQSFRLEPLQADKAVALPLEPIRFRSDGQQANVTLKPFAVEVTTVVLGPSLGALKENTPPEELPDPGHFDWQLYALGGGGCVLLVILGWLVRRRLRRPAPPVPELPADQWALRELVRLDAVQRFHALLADVLRTYLDRRFGLHSSEQTTREFLSTLKQSSTLPEDQQDQLRSVLERCDLAKFARIDYSPSDCRATAQQARDFVARSAAAMEKPAETVLSR
jgi:hypothetical protein